MANWLTFQLFGDLYICIHIRICMYIYIFIWKENDKFELFFHDMNG